jgi:hypothetical protein
MTHSMALSEPAHVDEPQLAGEYADVLSRVATEQQPVVVRRSGEDLAAVVPLGYLELLQELVARQEAARLSRAMDWDRLVRESRPAPEWFEQDEPKPF